MHEPEGVQLNELRRGRALRTAQGAHDEILALADMVLTELGSKARVEDLTGIRLTMSNGAGPLAAREDGGTEHYTITMTDMHGHCIVYENPPGICREC